MTADAQEAIVSTFRFLEKLYGKYPTNAEVFAIARRAKQSFDTREGTKLLSCFRFKKVGLQSDSSPDSVPESPRKSPEPVPPQSQFKSLTRAGVVPTPVPIPDSVPSVPHQPLLAAIEPEKPKLEKPRQLRFGDPAEETARAMLAAVWPSVQAAVCRSMTRTRWSSKNKLIALDLARVGRSVADVVDAHARASERRGGTVWSFTIVQEQFMRDDAPARGSPYRGNRQLPDAAQLAFVADLTKRMAARSL